MRGNISERDKLFPWQKSLLREIAHGHDKYVALEKSRRIGGTWIIAISAVQYCLCTGHNCWFSSSDEKNGREFVLYVRAFCEVLNCILETPYVDLSEATTESVALPNGSRISVLSSNPRALRGKDGLIVLDEVALHEDQEELFRAAHCCVVQSDKLFLLSTHDGPQTLFAWLAHEAEAGKPDWSHHRVTLEEAVRQGYARRFAPHQRDEDFILTVRRSCLSNEVYGQEYGCLPISLASLIKPEVYDAVAHWSVPDELDPEARYRDLYVGIDPARCQDRTGIVVIEQYENP